MKYLIVILLVLLPAVVVADQRYNPFEDRWETIPDNSDWNMRYNVFENNWSYQPQEAEIEYNTFEDKWQWDSGHGNEPDGE